MKDRFAAAWADLLTRHRGKRIGTIWFDANDISGDVTLTAGFLDMPALVRADVLQDVIGVLQREYELAAAGIFDRSAQ
jgi:hypothetical protein